MDPETIKRLLMSLRGSSPDVATAGATAAPIPGSPPGMDQAMNAPMPGVQNQTPPPMSPSAMPSMNFNPAGEQQAQGQGNIPMDPIIQAIMKHFGMMNKIRNTQNMVPQVDPIMQANPMGQQTGPPTQ